MTHLTTLAFVLIFVAIAVSKKYDDGNGKLMPASTPEGMRARIILIPIVLIGVAALITNYMHPQDYMRSPLWILVSVITVTMPIVAYIKFKRKKK